MKEKIKNKLKQVVEWGDNNQVKLDLILITVIVIDIIVILL